MPGEGGNDSASFARDLAKVYSKWGERCGTSVRVVSRSAKRIEMELAGASVLEVAHRRSFADISVGDVGIVLHLETRGRDHVRQIVKLLEAQGHKVETEA